ncbi:DNA-binding transcriptional regulator, PadR family [Natronorubrum texcoconense]|uniref:DNA-binding transcriptional regulator, PadR family n=1 Tax=Natronorubrum texcoconense TaxID=1095776 RepID=A0A1G9HAL5_9EURY|nr:DNA-binding transcriptional regulator, PadR family [Natronorubrum texcoconense]
MANDDKSEPETMGELPEFQRDALFAIAALERPNGLEIKQKLEDYYGTEENHGRLYPNLDALVEGGYVTKAEADGRTNVYTLTDSGWQALDNRRSWEASCVGHSDDQIGLTGDVHDLLLNYQRDGEDMAETLHRLLSIVPHPVDLPSSASAATIERDELVIARARDIDDYLDTFVYESQYDVYKDIEQAMRGDVEVPADD